MRTEGWPRTWAEAEVGTYNCNPVRLGRHEWVEECCAAHILDDFQCGEFSGYGPAGLYCRQHAKIMEQDNGNKK